jgi:hypothetical protein
VTKLSHSHIATIDQSASQSWCQALPGLQDQIFVTVKQLRYCRCGAPSLTRGQVIYRCLKIGNTCHLYLEFYMFGGSVKLQLAIASTVIPGFSLQEIHDQDIDSLLDM